MRVAAFVARQSTCALLLLALATQAAAQQAGWRYSPLPGEGDRAALGCGHGADASRFTCLAVRCEDDYAVGLHIHTSREGGDAGRWRLDIDKESFTVDAAGGDAPYGARIAGDVETLIDRLKHGAIAYLDAVDGPAVERNGIALAGSLYAINQALYFCAPRNPQADAEPE
jgi:hypothetical protein